jgi:RNA polymerase sigma-32 factor
LEAGEERTLVKRWRENDDVPALHKLTKAYLKLVVSRACKYHWAAPLDELVSAGAEGLIKAIKNFDPDKGFLLATYAIKWIDGELKKHLKQGLGSINHLRHGHETAPEVGPCWKDGPLGSSLKNIFISSEDENGDIWQDRLTSDGANATLATAGNGSQLRDHQEAILAEAETARHSETLNEVVNRTLNDRERRIFQARYMAEEPLTRETLSSEFGVSGKRIREIEVRAFEKVEKAAKSHPTLSVCSREEA